MTEAHRPVAIVTGANRGTGLAIAAELHAGGWDVWGLNRTSAGRSWLPEARCDLESADAVTAAVETVARRRGRIDALVVNAVARSLGRIGTLSLPDWRAAFDVNIVSVLPLLQAALPYLRPRKGSIVLMGSHAGSRYFEGGGAYCASKAALKALAEVLLLEERPNGVRTTLINPGAIANEIGDDSPFKLSTSSVAQAVRWVVEAPADTAIGEIELRPAHLPAMAVTGLNRLQAV